MRERGEGTRSGLTNGRAEGRTPAGPRTQGSSTLNEGRSDPPTNQPSKRARQPTNVIAFPNGIFLRSGDLSRASRRAASRRSFGRAVDRDRSRRAARRGAHPGAVTGWTDGRTDGDDGRTDGGSAGVTAPAAQIFRLAHSKHFRR